MFTTTRRQLLSSAAALLSVPFITKLSYADSPQRKLAIPYLLTPEEDAKITLRMHKGTHSFTPGLHCLSGGISASSHPLTGGGYSYAIDYLGPTIRLQKGQTVNFNVVNHLDEPTTLHWHGLFVPSTQDGGPHNTIEDKGEWNVKIKVDQAASTNWYHPHPHQNTARQAHMGLAGFIIVDDGKDEELGLPNRYGIDDIPLVLQDRRVLEGSKIYEPDFMDMMHGFRGKHVIVNGSIEPVAEIPAGLVRLRLLNGSNARIFNLAFTDKRPMHVIASDGGAIGSTTPVALEKLVIAPGERYEVLVDFSSNDKATFVTSAYDNGQGGDLKLMDFVTSAELTPAITALPAKLDTPAIDRKKWDIKDIRERSFVFNERMMENMQTMMGDKKHKMDHPMAENEATKHDNSDMTDHAMMHGGRSSEETGPTVIAAQSPMRMALNEQTFDMNRIDVEAKLGSYELWRLASLEMPHPFHIHGASFFILSINGEEPPAHLRGWKDTALVDGTMEVIIHFNRKADKDHPFMFHCHVLEHEDLGMMGQFITS